MAYRLPTFNITVNVWHFPHVFTDPPDLSPVANFAVGKRINHILEGEVVPGSGPFGFSWLLCPALTNIIGDTESGGFGDLIEIPAGSGRFYHCAWSDVSAMGFLNEHIVATVFRLSAPPPPPGDEILLEDGTDLLIEDGTPFLLE